MTEDYANRKVLNQEPNSDARLMATLIYVLSFLTTFLAPLIIWLIKREDSAFVDRAGKNYFNFLISYVIWFIISCILMLFIICFFFFHILSFFFFFIIIVIFFFISVILMLIIIGFFLFPIVAILNFIFTIVAAVKAYNGEDYLPPLSIRFFK